MANVDVKSLSKDDKDELVCTYAALLLHDEGLDITVSFASLTTSLTLTTTIVRERN